ncbi:hypothetical protein B9Z19DRAFT_1080205 [Tuber borchii]|uniref:Uncharacterized protein n=1 Tax=Tuber borchii TaxID=42251 RepID=A0A2T6ZX49_TUBBO|nr:hypothetical protein B9Z19DRAFT_1080205 [Tuber borchii]
MPNSLLRPFLPSSHREITNPVSPHCPFTFRSFTCKTGRPYARPRESAVLYSSYSVNQ